ncbi:unnamed protein product [Rangifer tarandus platyrhynchus]|uniref:Uncharacterized protein n=1 Tax=Rangifer tarandus platyrhynchus TaxID=3082113 RepID=A0ABN8ZQT1_RANTA|nr:unnamed protein product [Rangifer tarandus platyrhynchus]
MGFSSQEYWSGLPFPSPGDLPDSGIEPHISCIARWDSLPLTHQGSQSDTVCVLGRFSPTLCNPMEYSQAPLSVGFPRQEYWSGLPCPPPGDLPDPVIEHLSLMSPALAGGFFTTSATWEAPK